jgi:hypothetical protein
VFYLVLGLVVCVGLIVAIWAIILPRKELHSFPQLLFKQQSVWLKRSDRLGRNGTALKQKLLKRLHYDQAAADRLLTAARFKYPGRSQQWYLEKVIYDLDRDRRS